MSGDGRLGLRDCPAIVLASLLYIPLQMVLPVSREPHGTTTSVALQAPRLIN